MVIVGMWFAGFLVGIGIGSYLGKIGERKEWDRLIREGKLPVPGQRWKPEDYKKSEK